MLTTNGSCVIRIGKTSAGSKGSRRRHAEENGSPVLPFASVTSTAEAVKGGLLDRLRCDLLALAQRLRVARRTGKHAREELRAPVADVLELRDADFLHARRPRSLGRTGIVDR